MDQVNFRNMYLILFHTFYYNFFIIFRTLTFVILILLEKGIDSHEIDLPGKKVFVTSKTLQKDGVEEIIKKTGLDTTFVGEKDA